MNMYARSDSVSLTVQSFALSRAAARSTEPEVFTFERVPAQATALRSYVPVRPKKRCTRVMYPAKVRMHLPPPERSRAKRWLLALCLVVLWQVWTEDPDQGLGLRVAEPQQQQLEPQQELSGRPEEEQQQGAGQLVPNTTCASARPAPGPDAESARAFEQSAAGKSYVVALLVYHRLGSDN